MCFSEANEPPVPQEKKMKILLVLRKSVQRFEFLSYGSDTNSSKVLVLKIFQDASFLVAPF